MLTARLTRVDPGRQERRDLLTKRAKRRTKPSGSFQDNVEVKV
jgi:hypothetical protein